MSKRFTELLLTRDDYGHCGYYSLGGNGNEIRSGIDRIDVNIELMRSGREVSGIITQHAPSDWVEDFNPDQEIWAFCRYGPSSKGGGIEQWRIEHK